MEENSQSSERIDDNNLITHQEQQIVDIPESANDPLSSEIIDNRRYHNLPNCRYPLPNDDTEMNRLKLEHKLFRYIWQGNYSAPVDSLLQQSGAKVLDIGCGTGEWIEDMFSNFPLAHFTGIDISPIFPQTTSQNLRFLQHNVIEGLPFEDDHFDYVHCRNCLTAFSTHEWTQRVIPEMIRVTKPLGFIEHCEVDGHHVNEGPIMRQITNAAMEFNASRDVDGMMGEKLDEILLQTGSLDNIHHQQKYSPLGGGWGSEYGKMAIDNFAQVSLALRTQLSEVMNIPPSEFDGIINRCVVESETQRTYFKTHRVYAQKRSSNL